MSNSIAYASIFNQKLDEKFSLSSRTQVLTNNSLGIIWEGGKNVKIPKLTTQGLGTVSGCTIPNGDYTFEYENKTLQWDRGRAFKIGRYDVEETNDALNVLRILSEFVRNNVVPEADKLRISTIATASINGNTAEYEGATAYANPLKAFIADVEKVRGLIGDDKRLVAFMSATKKTAIETSNELVKYLSVRDTERYGINTQAKFINDVEIIACPDSYMKSAFTLYDGTTSGQEAGGVVPASGAKDINWIIVAPEAVLAVAHPNVEKVITPDLNQDGDWWKVMFRTYHGLFTLDSKINGILANVAGEED